MRARAKARLGWRSLLGFIFLVVLLALLLTPTRWGGLPQPMERFVEIGRAMFQTYLLPFEVLSVLLLAALIGAVYMAKREERVSTPDEAPAQARAQNEPGEGKGGDP